MIGLPVPVRAPLLARWSYALFHPKMHLDTEARLVFCFVRHRSEASPSLLAVQSLPRVSSVLRLICCESALLALLICLTDDSPVLMRVALAEARGGAGRPRIRASRVPHPAQLPALATQPCGEFSFRISRLRASLVCANFWAGIIVLMSCCSALELLLRSAVCCCVQIPVGHDLKRVEAAEAAQAGGS